MFVVRVSAQQSYAKDVVVDESGFIYVSGIAEGHSFQGEHLGDKYTLKLDSNGALIWALNEGNNYFGHGLAVDSEGFLYLASGLWGVSVGDLQKISPEGEILWSKSLGTSSDATISDASISVSPNNEICSGVAYRDSDKNRYMWLSRYDASGNKLWSQIISSDTRNSWLTLATFATDSGCYMAGLQHGTMTFTGYSVPITIPDLENGETSSFLTFYDSSGELLWAKRIASGNVLTRRVGLSDDGTLYAIGDFRLSNAFFGDSTLTSLENTGSANAFISGFDAEGNAKWANSVAGMGFDRATSMAIDAEGNAIVAGQESANIYFSKYDSSGDLLLYVQDGEVSVNETIHSNSIAIGPNDEVVIAGDFDGTALFGPSTSNPIAVSGQIDSFVAKYDASGEFLWVQSSAYIPPVDPLADLYPRFAKLEVGNRWEFSIQNFGGASSIPGPYLVFDIVSEEIIDGLPNRIIRSREYELDGTLRDESICAVEYSDPNVINKATLVSCAEHITECMCMHNIVNVQVSNNSAWDISSRRQIEIGPWLYWTDAVADYSISNFGTGGAGGGEDRIYAADIGITKFGAWFSCHSSDAGCRDGLYWANLDFALVDGQTFGATQVSTELPIQIETDPRVSLLYPNPTTKHTKLDIYLDTGQTISAVIFDVLGRKRAVVYSGFMNQGFNTISIDGLSLSPGNYAVTIVGEHFRETRIFTVAQ